jgi:glycosyltransferase involved in cell wall biosynthesis
MVGNSRKTDLTVLLASLAVGGVGKMRSHLINQFSRLGLNVDLVLGNTDSPYIDTISSSVRVVDLGTSHAYFGVPKLAAYFTRNRPPKVLTQRIRVNILALRARSLSLYKPEIYVTGNTNISAQLASFSPEKKKKQLQRMRKYFWKNDGIFAVSHGVAEDLSHLIDYPLENIRVIRNPVITPELSELASRPVEMEPFVSANRPIIMGMGRLEAQKDFPTLISAFHEVNKKIPAYLVIVGEGNLRSELQQQIGALGIADSVFLPGYVKNPYPYLKNASLFVLSSLWEGSPNSLSEALAVGTPVVSTDCPNGPIETLQKGRYGPLVPMQDKDALAQAMLDTLQHPLPSNELKQAMTDYTLEKSAAGYLAAMGF